MIIAASGSQHKWGGHLGVPSHFAPVVDNDGAVSPLISRTVRQSLVLTDDVHLTAPPGDRRYEFEGVTTHERKWDEFDNEYQASRSLWSETGRTVLLLGDVFFTDHALATLRRSYDRSYRVFGRYRKSVITGTPYGEIFAASWWPDNHYLIDRHLRRVSEEYAAGRCKRRDGWTLLRSIQGSPLGVHTVQTPWFVEINDETDDIDFPADYARHPRTKGLPQQ